MMKRLFTICIGLLMSFLAQATHNRAGEIWVQQIGPLTVKATIITYTKASSTGVDRDTLQICWGDGTCEMVPRSNGGGDGEYLGNDVKYNTYEAEHTYAGRATYLISMTDPNRNAGVLNVNWPNSDGMPFHIQTSYTFLDPQFQGENSTPQLLQPPIDFACVGQTFVHNPNAYDIDDDSLSYTLVVPMQDVNVSVNNYVWPNMVGGGGISNLISLNPVTGTFEWNVPEIVGEYNIAIAIISYRDGVAIDTTIRDMQIFVQGCTNLPPEIETIDEICVVAGDLVSFDVTATDPDDDQMIKLTALGGPFLQDISPAQFPAPPHFVDDPLTVTFTWQTTCEHISDQVYLVVFRVTDDVIVFPGLGDTTGLATLKTVRIKVVAPAPEEVEADPQQGQIVVSWKKPYTCENAADEYFYRFSVWRRVGSNPFPIDTCETGLDGQGYERIAWLPDYPVIAGRYAYTDTEVERGRTYCYRILAHFAKLTAAQNPYNLVESLPSEEVCVQLSRDVPLLTRVSVIETDANNGKMDIVWTKPVPEDLDTLLNPGPYRYQLLRSEGIGTGSFNPVAGADFTSPTFWQANDTTFTDVGLNTLQEGYTYKVAFFVSGDNSEPFGSSEAASSPFLNISSSDEINTLSLDIAVPWANFQYDIFRSSTINGVFDSIGTTTADTYTDTGLINGQTYCYYIRTLGDYGVEGIAAPLINLSQRACGTPLDTIPPCSPTLAVDNLCNSEPNTLPDENANYLHWNNPVEDCPGSDDVAGYNIYFAAQSGQPLDLIETINNADDTTYAHFPDLGISGCYVITAFDFLGNESPKTDTICVDNCPLYELPNAFTPNGDGQNDLFYPRKNRYIARVDMRIFNRWGDLVYQTTDPQLNWNGTDYNGNTLAPATYFYEGRVYEQRVSGEVMQQAVLSGFIEILRE